VFRVQEIENIHELQLLWLVFLKAFVALDNDLHYRIDLVNTKTEHETRIKVRKIFRHQQQQQKNTQKQSE
jgi:hypothetical protein